MNIKELELHWYNIGFLAGALGTLLAVIVMLLIITPSVSASPYQLNLSTGELIDLNVSNETANIAIYILPNITNINNITWNNYTNSSISQNISWTNITNITNLTCINCTQNYTNNTEMKVYNYTYEINGTNGSFYTASQTDNVFVTKTSFNELSTNYNNLLNRVNEVNSTIGTTTTKQNNTAIWVVLVLIGLVSLLALIRTMGGE